jgi:SAM-dependent methyltransferase
MNTRDATALISGAVPSGQNQVWADFGAGDGMFSRALVSLLGAGSLVYAVDRDAAALSSVERTAGIVPVVADLTRPFELPKLDNALLDGALFANSLHFMRDADDVLRQLASLVKPGGRVVIIEYDRRGPNRWVPYPIPLSALPALAAAAGLTTPTIVATRPSLYGGDLYVAIADRSSAQP